MLHVITNNHPRPLLNFWDLSEKQQKKIQEDSDWLFDEPEPIPGSDEPPLIRAFSESFIVYKENIYCLSDFMRIPKRKGGLSDNWHGYTNETAFSGTLVRYVDDGIDNEVVMGYYWS